MNKQGMCSCLRDHMFRQYRVDVEEKLHSAFGDGQEALFHNSVLEIRFSNAGFFFTGCI